MKYLFSTTATMKEYNHKKWWIDSKIIPNITIDADNISNALKKYQQNVSDEHYIKISNNALKHKQNMYIDTEYGIAQTGYVITAKTDFENNYKWVTQYIDLWVNIQIVTNPFSEV